jgi:hypothetical protein
MNLQSPEVSNNLHLPHLYQGTYHHFITLKAGRDFIHISLPRTRDILLPTLDISLQLHDSKSFRPLILSTPIIKDSQKILPRGNSVFRWFMGYGLILPIGSCYVSSSLAPLLFPSPGLQFIFFHPLSRSWSFLASMACCLLQLPFDFPFDITPGHTQALTLGDLAHSQMSSKNERPTTPLKHIQ